MIELKVKPLKWGNSFGLRLKKSDMKKAHIRIGKETTVLIPEVRRGVEMKKIFGSLRGLKRSTEEMLKEIDEGW